MTHSKLTAMVREAAEKIDAGNIGAATAAAVSLREAGIVANVHVGRKAMTSYETVEWYAGQLVAIVEKESWFARDIAMNVWLSCVDKFVPEVSA